MSRRKNASNMDRKCRGTLSWLGSILPGRGQAWFVCAAKGKQNAAGAEEEKPAVASFSAMTDADR